MFISSFFVYFISIFVSIFFSDERVVIEYQASSYSSSEQPPEVTENTRPEIDEEDSPIPTEDLTESFKNAVKTLGRLYPTLIDLVQGQGKVSLQDGSFVSQKEIEAIVKDRDRWIRKTKELEKDLVSKAGIIETLTTQMGEQNEIKSAFNILSLQKAQEKDDYEEKIKSLQDRISHFESENKMLTEEKEMSESVLGLEYSKTSLLRSQLELKNAEMARQPNFEKECTLLKASNQKLVNEVSELRYFRDHISDEMINRVEERLKTRIEEISRECDLLRSSNSNLMAQFDKSEREKDRLQALYDSTQIRRASFNSNWIAPDQANENTDLL